MEMDQNDSTDSDEWRTSFIAKLLSIDGNADGRSDQLADILIQSWTERLPEFVFGGTNPIKLKYDLEALDTALLEPVEAFVVGSNSIEEKLNELKKNDQSKYLCNKAFASGEPTYSCRDCAVDQTCVLCVDCFKRSPHKGHRYKISTSGGGGYCDCGDPEAWKKDFACNAHKPPSLSDLTCDAAEAKKRLPDEVSRRFTAVTNAILNYAFQLLTATGEPVVCGVNRIDNPTETMQYDYVTIVYNDEVHTYDQVIGTLTRTLECTTDEALQYATLVDHDGRSPLKFGSKDECELVKGFVERNSRRPQPLRLQVCRMTLYMHQVMVLRVLNWLRKMAETCEGFKAIVCEVLLKVSHVTNDLPIASAFLLEDINLWKVARHAYHALFMSTFLSFSDAKLEFSRIFARLYPQLFSAFMTDDHDHGDSCTSLSVQIFTVPSVARALFSEKLVELIIKAFVLLLSPRRDATTGILSFDRTSQPASASSLKRALYILNDCRYLTNTVPSADQWTEPLRKGFLSAVDQLLEVMLMMEGMDFHVRRTQAHIEYESDWEQPFNIQLRMEPIFGQIQAWCASDDKVLAAVFDRVLQAAVQAVGPVDKCERKEVCRVGFDCIEYDVLTEKVSIHHPVIRLLAGIAAVAMTKNVVLNLSSNRLVRKTAVEVLKSHARELAEHPLRTLVLVAQSNCGMWRRNGYAWANQIFFYQQPRCREEMLDKDVVMLQAAASVMKPNEFLINALNRFGLIAWADEVFDASPLRPEDESIRQIILLAEEFYHFLIVVVGERYYPNVGKVNPDDCLENEVIHQLCMSPMSYSELVKSLPDHEDQGTDLDAVLRKVATLRRPTPASKGVFELKPEYTSRYNMFFYHFTRAEHSKAEDTQRKRKKKDGEEACFPPPVPPEFMEPFDSVTSLLDCEVFIHLANLTVRRALSQHPRSFSEGQLIRVLFLIGFALHEEKAKRERKQTDFKFLERAVDAGIFNVLTELKDQKDNDAYRGLVLWCLKFYETLLVSKDHQVVQTPEPPAIAEDMDERKRLAAQRRERIMQQMRQAQSSFASQNVGELEDIELPEVANRSVAAVVERPPEKPGVFGHKRGFAVIPPDEEKHCCLLCSDAHTISLSNEPFVAVAFVQRSTVMSAEDRMRLKEEVEREEISTTSEICAKMLPNPLLLPAELRCAAHVSTCGHLLHAKCWKGYFESIVARERRRSLRLRTNTGSFDVSKNEYRCPLCSRLCNAAIPLFPAPIPRELSTGNLTFESFMELLSRVFVPGDVKASGDAVENKANLVETFREGLAAVAGGPHAAMVRCVLEERESICRRETRTGTEQPLSEFLEALRTFHNQIYQVAFNAANPAKDEDGSALINWSSCSYTVQSIELVLRMDKKPLWGAFTSRQDWCLKSIIRAACWLSPASEHRLLTDNALRCFAAIFSPKASGESIGSALELDMFTLLVTCLCSFPYLPLKMEDVGGENAPYRPPIGDAVDHSILALVYSLHIMQVLVYLDEDSAEIENTDVPPDPALRELYRAVRQKIPAGGDDISDPSDSIPVQFEQKVRRAVMPFLRSSVILFHYLTGIRVGDRDEPVSASCDPSFDDLMDFLSLPLTFTELVNSSSTLQTVIQRVLDSFNPNSRSPLLKFPRPVPSFVRLPHDFVDVMTQTTTSQQMSRVDNVDERKSPAVCLLCGDIVCSQSLYAQHKLDTISVGACTYHAVVCGGGTGVFFRVRENQILALHGTNKGALCASPYVDMYGEPDAYLRRGNPLHLSEERIEQMLRQYVNHDVADEISHSMDQNGQLAAFEWHNF